jgi:hypothetical protein
MSKFLFVMTLQYASKQVQSYKVAESSLKKTSSFVCKDLKAAVKLCVRNDGIQVFCFFLILEQSPLDLTRPRI